MGESGSSAEVLTSFFQNVVSALAGVAQGIEHWPVNRKVTHSIPHQGKCRSCGPGPSWGRVRGN